MGGREPSDPLDVSPRLGRILGHYEVAGRDDVIPACDTGWYGGPVDLNDEPGDRRRR